MATSRYCASALAIAALLVWALVPSQASAEPEMFSIVLNSQNVVPPPPVETSGLMIVTLDPGTGQISGDVYVAVSPVDYEVHIHQGSQGINGPRLVTLDEVLPLNFSATLEPAVLDIILAGDAYLLVTTDTYPDGIVRGQFPPHSVSTDALDFGTLKGMWE